MAYNIYELPNFLRARGWNVWVDPEAHRRNHGALARLRAIFCHHTGGGGKSDWLTVRNGRPGLSGPLAQIVFEQDCLVRIISFGVCWHAGSGGPLAGIPANAGNTYSVGIEAVSNGSYYTPEQERLYPKLAQDLADFFELPSSAIVGHKEWAPTRKIDPKFVMNIFRALAAKFRGDTTSEENELNPVEKTQLAELHGHLVAARWGGLPGSDELNPGTGTVVEMIANTNWELREKARKEIAGGTNDIKDLLNNVLGALGRVEERLAAIESKEVA